MLAVYLYWFCKKRIGCDVTLSWQADQTCNRLEFNRGLLCLLTTVTNVYTVTEAMSALLCAMSAATITIIWYKLTAFQQSLVTLYKQCNIQQQMILHHLWRCTAHQSLSIKILQPYGLCFIFLVRAAMCFMLVHFASVQYPTSGSSCTPRKSTSLIADKACRVVKGDVTYRSKRRFISTCTY